MTGETTATISFWDGTRIAYDVPRDTLDKRYAACASHHPACDCREAERSEDLAELRARLDEIEEAALEVLAGHHAYAWRRNPVSDEEEAVHCMCTGCQIARRGHLLAAWTVSDPRPDPEDQR